MKELKLNKDEITDELDRIASSSSESRVSIVGSMNADNVVEVETMPQPGETIIGGPMAVHAGGKSANQAASCARLQLHTDLIGAVGSDASAEFLLHELDDAGVGIGSIEHVEGPSGSTIIVVDPHGENFIVVSSGANGKVDGGFVHRHSEVIERSDILGLCLEAPLQVVAESSRIAHAAHTRVVLNISPMPEDLNPSLKHCLADIADIAVMNEHETAQWLGLAYEPNLESDWDDLHDQLCATGLGRVVITLGAAGSVILDGSQALHIPAFTVQPVDTTGAGDSFMGSMLASLASGNSLDSACEVASAVSAFSTLGKGAQSSYGDTQQITDFVLNH
ncbi:MAG: ribokinase [Bifidobacterium aquikefiri]|uniref:Ribokinase n=1 Tax=Bifidobacterium aquikefiri TaxID=1653207 RepID=A0A261G8Y6_9BIFI|nr:ribokinase [Bifidobacterium aquikefiri]OZG67880.1 sugar kinase [Bifidobacterium aquikefiri]